jgi:hypothetical protein
VTTIPRVLNRARGFFMEKNTNSFNAILVVHPYTQTNPAPPKKVFPLLCPVREFEKPNGFPAGSIALSIQTRASRNWDGSSPHPSRPALRTAAASEMTWIVTDYDLSAFRIAYVWKQTGVIIAELRIQLELLEPAEIGTKAHIRYRYTGCRSWAVASSRATTVNGSKPGCGTGKPRSTTICATGTEMSFGG